MCVAPKNLNGFTIRVIRASDQLHVFALGGFSEAALAARSAHLEELVLSTFQRFSR